MAHGGRHKGRGTEGDVAGQGLSKGSALKLRALGDTTVSRSARESVSGGPRFHQIPTLILGSLGFLSFSFSF